jgi:hypothetical protein
VGVRETKCLNTAVLENTNSLDLGSVAQVEVRPSDVFKLKIPSTKVQLCLVRASE